MNGRFSRAVQIRNHEPGGLPAALKRASAVLLALLAMSGCSPDPPPPDTSGRESFARTVMSAAASGSVEQDLHDHVEQGALGLGHGRSCPSSGWWGKRRAEPGPRCGTH